MPANLFMGLLLATGRRSAPRASRLLKE
jgi:hypothetical protein